MGKKRVRQPKIRGKKGKENQPRPPPEETIDAIGIPQHPEATVPSSSEAVDLPSPALGERDHKMFRTIKKNILTPLLPKVNEIAEEAGEKGGVNEAKSQDANPIEPPAPEKKPEPVSPKATAEVGSKIVEEPKTTEPSAPLISEPEAVVSEPEPIVPEAEPAPTPVEKAQDETTNPAVKAAPTRPKPKNVSEKEILIKEKEINMGNINASLEELMKIDGAVGVAVVDSESGMALGTSGGGGLNLELAAAGNSEVVKAKNNVRDALGLKDSIDDILITLTTQYHLIRPLTKSKNLFIYLVLNRKQANLAMARMKLAGVEGTLEV